MRGGGGPSLHTGSAGLRRGGASSPLRRPPRSATDTDNPLTTREKNKSRLAEEAELLAKINHANVVRLILNGRQRHQCTKSQALASLPPFHTEWEAEAAVLNLRHYLNLSSEWEADFSTEWEAEAAVLNLRADGRQRQQY